MVTLDLSGEECPYTFLRIKLLLEELPVGARVDVLVDSPAAAINVPRSLRNEGQEIVSVETLDETRTRVIVEKRWPPASK